MFDGFYATTYEIYSGIGQCWVFVTMSDFFLHTNLYFFYGTGYITRLASKTENEDMT